MKPMTFTVITKLFLYSLINTRPCFRKVIYEEEINTLTIWEKTPFLKIYEPKYAQEKWNIRSIKEL